MIRKASGSSVPGTQQEFHQAVSKRKPILVFIQQTDFDAKQAVFVNEVSDYKQGFFRASFSDPQELLKAIVQGLSRMEKSKSAISEKAFTIALQRHQALAPTAVNPMRHSLSSRFYHSPLSSTLCTERPNAVMRFSIASITWA